MDQYDAFAGSSFAGDSAGLANTFLLTPAFVNPATNAPYTAAGPCIVTGYNVAQSPTGDGIVLLIFDTTTLPANGRAVWTAPKPKLVIPFSPGGMFNLALAAPWHRYASGLCMVMSSDWTTINYAMAQTFFSVKYAQAAIGGMAYNLV